MRIEEGTVARIDGRIPTTFSNPTVGEDNDEGTFHGIQMYIDGDWEVPADKTNLEVTGTFVKGTYYMEFHVQPENITVK